MPYKANNSYIMEKRSDKYNKNENHEAEEVKDLSWKPFERVSAIEKFVGNTLRQILMDKNLLNIWQ